MSYAAEHSFAIPAFNVSNMEQVQAIMQAADASDSPVIMQGSAGANRYAGEVFLCHLILAAVEQYPHIPIVMHRDHACGVSVEGEIGCLGSLENSSNGEAAAHGSLESVDHSQLLTDPDEALELVKQTKVGEALSVA